MKKDFKNKIQEIYSPFPKCDLAVENQVKGRLEMVAYKEIYRHVDAQIQDAIYLNIINSLREIGND